MAVAIIEYALDTPTWVADENAIIDGEPETIYDEDFFIVAKTIDGATFISEDISREDVIELFRLYKSMVGYFGGGVVALMTYTVEDYEEVFHDIVY